MKHSFLQAAVVSILLYGCTTWTLTKRLEKKLVLAGTPHKSLTIRPPASHHENYPSSTNQTCKSLLEKQGRAHKWCTPMYSYGPSHMAGQKQDNQHEHTSSSYVKIQGVALKTCQRWWNDREKWRERVRDIHAYGTTWWWWWKGTPCSQDFYWSLTVILSQVFYPGYTFLGGEDLSSPSGKWSA